MKRQSVFKVFLKYVSLGIFGQMAYSCYTLADTFFVSASLGANGLAALNIAFPMFCLINGTGLMIGMGGGTRYSILKSGGEEERANRVFTNCLFMAGAFSLLYGWAGGCFADVIARGFGADGEVLAMTRTYLKVMLLFAPAFLFNHLLQSFVRNDGSPTLSAAAMITGSLSNVILDYLLIFPLRMGIFGAILATGIAPLISMSVLSVYLIRKKNRFRAVRTAPDGSAMLSIAASGVPSLVAEVSSGVVMLLFNFILLRLAGNIGVAAFSVITVISLVVVAIFTGLSQGIQPVVSACYGAGKESDGKAILKYAFIAVVLLSCVIYGAIYLGAAPIVRVFNSERNGMLQELAVEGMRFYFLACPFVGFNMMAAAYFTSTERTRPAQAISALRSCFLLIPVTLLLSSAFQMTGVWCAYPVTECIVSWIGAAFLFSGKGKKAAGTQ